MNRGFTIILVPFAVINFTQTIQTSKLQWLTGDVCVISSIKNREKNYLFFSKVLRIFTANYFGVF